MSNYNLKAKNRITGEIVSFYALDNYFGSHRYGYQINNPTLEFNELEYVYNHDDFNKLYEIVKDIIDIAPELGLDKTRFKPLDFGVIKQPIEDPNHPYGGMEVEEERFFVDKNQLIGLKSIEPNISFGLKGNEEMVKITKDGFYYKGEKVDDVHNVYERFNEWLTLSHRGETITTLLEKQREDIQFKLNKHWDKLESNKYDFKDMENWRIFKCIRNNNNDVINDKTS